MDFELIFFYDKFRLFRELHSSRGRRQSIFYMEGGEVGLVATIENINYEL